MKRVLVIVALMSSAPMVGWIFSDEVAEHRAARSFILQVSMTILNGWQAIATKEQREYDVAVYQKLFLRLSYGTFGHEENTTSITCSIIRLFVSG